MDDIESKRGPQTHTPGISEKTRPGQSQEQKLPYLVGGFNPIEKYDSKWVHLPQFSG